MVAGSVGPQKLDITYPTNEFKRLAKSWEHFDLGVMDLNVTHIKKYVRIRDYNLQEALMSLYSAQLPNWVFEGGVRPLPKGTKRTKPTKVRIGFNTDLVAQLAMLDCVDGRLMAVWIVYVT